MAESKHPRIGVGALVIRDGKLLLGERLGSHGANTWSPAGGHLEFGESPADCAARELKEETGMIAKSITHGPWTNDYFESDQKHYITLFMLVEADGEPRNLEPEKCLCWSWFPIDQLPSPLFLSLENLLRTHDLLDHAIVS